MWRHSHVHTIENDPHVVDLSIVLIVSAKTRDVVIARAADRVETETPIAIVSETILKLECFAHAVDIARIFSMGNCAPQEAVAVTELFAITKIISVQ